MARVLLVWELGGGLGHLGRLLPLSKELLTRGHEVALVCRNPGQAEALADDPRLRCLAAPELGLRQRIVEPANYAEILIQFGFDDPDVLDAYLRVWLTVYANFRPDIIVFDFSPGALAAAMAFPAQRVLFGTGFACPPDATPLSGLRPWQEHYPERLMLSEAAMLESLNEVLPRFGGEPLDYFAVLFSRVDLNVLTTFEELDHCPGPRRADYWGNWSLPGGAGTSWTAGAECSPARARIFAYLKPFQDLTGLIEGLQRRCIDTLLYAPGLEDDLRAKCMRGCVQITDRPVSIPSVVQTVDLAITHAGHGVAADMLLAGIPVLAIPQYAEQHLLGLRIAAMGAGCLASLGDLNQILGTLDTMLSEPGYRKAAQVFADRYAGRDADAMMTMLVTRIEALTKSHALES